MAEPGLLAPNAGTPNLRDSLDSQNGPSIGWSSVLLKAAMTDKLQSVGPAAIEHRFSSSTEVWLGARPPCTAATPLVTGSRVDSGNSEGYFSSHIAPFMREGRKIIFPL